MTTGQHRALARAPASRAIRSCPAAATVQSSASHIIIAVSRQSAAAPAALVPVRVLLHERPRRQREVRCPGLLCHSPVREQLYLPRPHSLVRACWASIALQTPPTQSSCSAKRSSRLRDERCDCSDRRSSASAKCSTVHSTACACCSIKLIRAASSAWAWSTQRASSLTRDLEERDSRTHLQRCTDVHRSLRSHTCTHSQTSTTPSPFFILFFFSTWPPTID